MAMWLTALLALGPTASTRAQSATGTIDGQVVDQSGAALPGVVITVHQSATGVERTVVSDTTGRFRVPLLPVGVYDLTATRAGFDPKRETAIRLMIGHIVTQRIELRDYDFHPDRRTLVLVRPAGSLQGREVTIAVNWSSELRDANARELAAR